MPAEAAYLRVRDVAQQLAVNADTVLGWIARGDLRAIDVSAKRGKRPRWRIDAEALDLFVAARTTAPTQRRLRRRRLRELNLVEFF